MERYDDTRRRHRSRSRSIDRGRDKTYKSKQEKRDARSSSASSSEDRGKHMSTERESSSKYERSNSSDSVSSRSDSSSERKKHKSSKRHKTKEHKRSKDKKRRSRSIDRKKRPLSQDEIDRLKKGRKEEKELIKAVETPEEKRTRRLAKKEAKEKKRKEKMGWDAEYMGYTNGDNPFGDEHLLDTFFWSKKLEKEGLKDLTNAEVERLQKKKMMENKLELEKVKKRRLEREKEMEEREKDREKMQREKETEYYSAWEKQEDQFHLQQAKLRSKIRIEDGRAKPIDLLAKYISAEDDDLAIEMHEPYTYLNGLTIQDLEDLLEDIKVYIELEQGKNVDYWKDITIITDDELSKLKKMDPTHRGYIGERRSGINTAVSGDVMGVFKGKTLNQLAMLENTIKQKLRGGEAREGVDISYWESLLQSLRAHMARTRIREKHQEQLKRKLFKLKQEQGIDSSPLFPIMSGDARNSPAARSPSQRGSSKQSSPAPTTSAAAAATLAADQPETSKQGQDDPQASSSQKKDESVSEDDVNEAIMKEEDIENPAYQDYDSGRYSPKLLQHSELEADTIVYDPEDDIKRLEYARKQRSKSGKAKDETDDEFVKKAREGMTNDEAQFSVEVPLEQHTLLWSDKYRPRKPRFFNRVHTGFEWNKYNQTHYDIDNPPPKIVQGYKFNIFYPDLIDKTKTPEYFLTACDDNKDFGVLRFHAGPPYEDIAFKIVNREWEYSYKRGFRCQFHNNIFQLWFHFKRYRYRR